MSCDAKLRKPRAVLRRGSARPTNALAPFSSAQRQRIHLLPKVFEDFRHQWPARRTHPTAWPDPSIGVLAGLKKPGEYSVEFPARIPRVYKVRRWRAS